MPAVSGGAAPRAGGVGPRSSSSLAASARGEQGKGEELDGAGGVIGRRVSAATRTASGGGVRNGATVPRRPAGAPQLMVHVLNFNTYGPGTAVHIAVSPGRCGPWTAKLCALFRSVARGSCGATPITAVTSASMRAWSMVWRGLADAVIDFRGLEGVQDLQRCGLVKGHRAWCPFASTIGLVSLTIARLPLQREQLRRRSLATCTTRWNAISRPMRRAEGLDVSSFAAQDACAAEQPPPAKRSPCRAGSPGAAPANPVEGMEVAALGVHRMHREWGCDARSRLACSSTTS